MAIKTKFKGKTKSVGLRVEDLGGSNREYLRELGDIFQSLASHLPQPQIDQILQSHPKGNAIIEAIP